MGELEDPSAWRRLGQASWLLLRTGAVAYVLWLGAACLLQRKVLFPTYAVGAPRGQGFSVLGGEQGWLETPAGPVEWWFFPQPAASPERPAPLVVYTHGNAELIDHQAPEVERYRALGFHVLLCEYRGYGRSAGSPSQDAIVEDQVRALDLALGRPEVDRGRLLIHGRSVGTGVACALALERPPRALVLTAPFTSVRGMLARYAVPGFLAFDPFDNAGALEALDLPTLILHGERDRTIPVEHGRQLARDHAGARLVLVPGVGHNDFPAGGEQVVGAIRDFVREVGLVPPARE